MRDPPFRELTGAGRADSRISMTARRPPTLLARCSVLLVLLAGLAGPLHHALVRHAVCAEHGESLHVGDAPSASAHEHERSAGPSVVAGSPAAADHAVCEIVLVQRESMPAPAIPALALAVAVRPIAAPPVRVERVESIARFLLAPKQSPPA